MEYEGDMYWHDYVSIDCGNHAEVWARSVLLEAADQRWFWCIDSHLLDTFDLFVN
jgi:hypothetical protein